MADAEARIDLRILSPGQGVPETIDIQDVPISTQISKLKERITIVAPSHPPPDVQRLIYQGHVLADSNATLQSVFGSEALREHRSFTLHLVVRQLGVTQAPSLSQPQPQAGARTNTPPQGPQTGPIPNVQVPAVPPNALPFARPPILPPGIPGFPLPFPHQHFPGQHQQGARTVQGQTHAGVGGQTQPGMPQVFQGFPPMFARPQMGPPGLAGVPLPANMQVNAQAAPGTPSQPVGDGSTATGQTQGEISNTDQPAPQQQAPQQHLPVPHGVRYQMTVNQTFGVPGGQQHNMPGFPQHFPPQPQMPQMPQHGHPFQHMHHQHALAQQMAIQNQLQQRFGPQLGQQGREREGQVTDQNNTANATASSSSQPAAPTLPGVGNANTAASSESLQPTVYLLSSPTGPHAVLYHPQGTFNSLHSLLPQPGSIPDPIASLLGGSRRNTPSPFRPTPTTNAPEAAQQQQQQQQQRNPDQIVQEALQNALEVRRQGNAAAAAAAPRQDNAQGGVDILGPVQPLLGQLWFLFRILLFAYFFLGGDLGWRRPLYLLGICLVFLILRGIDAGAGIQNRVRGWWDGVMGLPPRPQGEQTQNQNQTREQAQQGQQNAQPAQQAPQQEQYQQQELGPWRARLRPLERALALFVASLWPGLGEQTVRARREEDQRQQREREENERRAQEEQQQQQQIEQGDQTVEVPLSAAPDSTPGAPEASASGAEPVADTRELRERRKGGETDGTAGETTVGNASTQQQQSGVDEG